MKKITAIHLVGIFVALSVASPAASAGEITVSGTGMALAAMEKIGSAFSANQPKIKVKVLPSMGSTGGIKALKDHVLDVSLAARDLKTAEIKAGIVKAFCFRTALVFATQPHLVTNFQRSELPSLYNAVAPKWADGTPLKVILRAVSGSEQPYLAERVPGLAEAFAAARQRPEVPVGMTDQENVRIAEIMTGAFAITTLLQINGERLRLAPVPIDGIAPSPATIENGQYPFAMKICLLSRQDQHSDDVAALLSFLKSSEGTDIIGALGATSDN